MATHDYNIANQIGSEFRADLNNALLAIVTNNSNASSPSTTFARQIWIDTSTNTLKIRNAANDAWVTTGISLTTDNSFTGNITGNSATATALATARTINGVSFDGTANISFNSDSVSEGSSNKYFTNERVDDQVNSLLTAGSGISLTYDDAAGTLTIANTNSADITSVVAGDGLTGGGTSGDVTLAVSVDDSSIEINSDALRVKASGITNAMLGGSIANSKLANSSVTINSQAITLGGSHTFDSDDIGEGSSNLYFTNARARGSLSIGSEGSASGNGAIAYNSSTGVFTYTPPVISGLSGDTDDLSEGSSNLYYTDARANSAIDARVTNTFINNLSGVVADTATALATARSIALSGDVTASGVNFDGTGDITLSTTIAANSVALGTDTTGNYVATVAGTTNEIEVSGSGSETASVTIGLPDNVTIAGNLTVNGTTTTVNTETLEVEDPLIKLARANSGADSVDIGFYGLYDTSGSQDLYAGLFRDASDSGKFKLFKDLQAEPTTTVNTAGTGYAVGTLVSNLEGDVTGNVTGNVSGTAATVTGAAQPNITSLGTLTTLTVDDITINGSTISDAGDLTLDVGGEIELDSDGGKWKFHDGGTQIGRIENSSNDFVIKSSVNDKDIIFKGEDGGSSITALTLDMSDAGKAFFNSDVQSSTKLITKTTTGEVLRFERASDSLRYNSITSNSTDGGGAFISFKVHDGVSATSQADVLHLKGDGNVGIGTTSPASTLEVNNASAGATVATFEGQFSGNGDVKLASFERNGGAVAAAIEYNDATTDMEFGTTTSHAFSFKTADTRRLTIDNSGRVGIGTTSPGQKLDVAGNITADAFIGRSNISVPTGDASIFRVADNTLAFATASTERMRIDSSGKVGIGTTSPSHTVHVVSSGNGEIKAERTSGAAILTQAQSALGKFGTTSNHNLQFMANNAGHLTITTAGNVGIGTSSPSQALEVSGAIKMSDGILSSGQAGSASVFNEDGTTADFRVESTSNTHMLFVDGGLDRVGIGTSSPADRLHVALESSTTNAEVEVMRIEASCSGTPAVGFGAFIDFRGDRITGGVDSYGRLGFEADAMPSTKVDGAFVIQPAEDGTYTERFRVSSDGNVGIGTASPTSKLHIDGAEDGSGGITLSAGAQEHDWFLSSDLVNVHNIGTGSASAAHTWQFNGTETVRFTPSGVGIGTTSPARELHLSATTPRFRLEDSDGGFSEISGSGGHLTLSADGGASQSASRMAFEVDGSEKMRLDSSGRLGIGTTSISSSLDSHGAKATTAGIPSGIINATDTTALAAGNGGAINFSGVFHSGGNITAYASIEASKENATHNEHGAALVFKTREDQGTQNEHMRVTSTGHVLLGTTSNQGVGGLSFQHTATGVNIQQNMDGTSGGAELYVFRRNSTQIGSINQSSTNAVQYNTSSDARLKDVTGSSRGLDVINNLNPVAYNWKSDNHADEGLIAQEVEELVPNAVNQGQDGYYSMDYSKLVTHLVKGMQEQQEQIELLKSEIANLKEK